MQLKLLVVLEAGENASKVGEYVARVCAGGPDVQIVLFMQLPALPSWVEAGDSRDVVTQRRRYEAEAREQTTKYIADVRSYLVQHGVSGEAITEEMSEESDLVVPEIRASAHRHGCDTIVVARHHKSIMREFLEGDFEEKLLRRPIEFTVWLVA